MMKVLVRGIVGVVGLLIMLTPVFANSSSYSFTMDYRYVNGKSNGVTHGLDAGYLTNSGVLWAYAKAPGAVGPYPVTIAVVKDELIDRTICTVSVTPYTTLGVIKSFSQGCGNVKTGVYYIEAWKANDDGWDIKVIGTLTTQ